MKEQPESVVLGNLAALDSVIAAMRARDMAAADAARRPSCSLPELVISMREKFPPKPDAEIAQWEWNNTILPNLRASRLPPRFHFEITHWTEPLQFRTLETCRRLCAGRGAIIALIGPRGLGKTTIASQLILERTKDEARAPWERRPPYRKLTDLIAAYKSIYADFGSIDADQVMEARDGFCKLHPLVIIDELHECDDQRLKDRILTDILDRRYANLNDTILITNQTPDEFMKTTNDSILSRLSEHGRVISCNWKSFRTQ